eukprot:TRINITY_DN13892_c0_g1_i1.p1 TRINITY_DN13892_c0_g1~~TRINITY_DN13892_c0_g1_i1.p1  ORF type:complete len:418 (+),score=98.84 TRINITY_DN13892_c0_g1_i1:125-1378(+)
MPPRRRSLASPAPPQVRASAPPASPTRRSLASPAPPEVRTPAPPAPTTWPSWFTRTISTLVMVSAFALVIYSGHIVLVALILLLDAMVFREVMEIGYSDQPQHRRPSTYWTQWLFFVPTVFFVHVRAMKEQIAYSLPEIANNYYLVTFLMLMGGLVVFVITLRRPYKSQVQHFARTLVSLLLVVMQTGAMVHNMFSALIWFLLPVSSVIVNDITAYIFGMLFGRTRLVRVSPKKTWEGFIGALFCTMLWAWAFISVFAQYEMMVCHKNDLSFAAPVCDVAIEQLHGGLFQYRNVPFGAFTISAMPAHWHSLAIAVFASLLAPFGGFLASAVKRAFRIKDFGDTIPGHGGITDRMDCQFLTGTFTFVWLATFVRQRLLAVPFILSRIALLSKDDVLLLMTEIAKNETLAPILQRQLLK